MKSLETGYWVDEEPYELADAFPSAQVTETSCLCTYEIRPRIIQYEKNVSEL